LEEWNVQRSQQVLEWQREAEIKLTRAHLLDVLRLRFRAGVPEDIASAVAAMTDFDELSRWFRLAASVDSLDAFRVAVQTATGSGPAR
jgi:hypothetical protein